MKKIVLHFSVILSVLSILLYSSPAILRILKLDKNVKNFVLQRALRSQEGLLDLSRFDFNWDGFSLSDVTFFSQDQRLNISVKRILFKTDALAILRSVIKKQKLFINQVNLIEPKIIYHQFGSVQPGQDPAEQPQISQILNKLKALNLVHISRIENGAVVLQMADGEYIRFARNINGTVRFGAQDQYLTNLTGNLLENEQTGFSLQGQIDLQQQLSSLLFKSDMAEIPQDILRFIAPDWHLTRGSLSTDLEISLNHNFPDSSSLKGLLALNDLSAGSEKLLLDSASVRLRFDGGLQGSLNAAGKLQQARFEITALIPEITDSLQNFEFRISDLIASDFFHADFHPDLPAIELRGKGRINLRSASVSADVLARTETISLSTVPESARFNLSYSAGRLTIENFLASNRYSQIQAGLSFLPQTGSLQGELNISTLTGVGSGAIFKTPGAAVLNLKFSRMDQKFAGNWEFLFSGTNGQKVQIPGRAQETGSGFEIVSEPGSVPGFNLHALAGVQDGRLKISNGVIRNFPFDLVWDGFPGMLKKMNNHLTIETDRNSLMTQLWFVPENATGSPLRISTRINLQPGDEGQVKGTFNIGRMPGIFDITLNRDRLVLTLESEAGLNGSAVVDLTGQRNLDGRLVINELALNQFDNLPNLSALHLFTGTISGLLNVGGTSDKPDFNFRLFSDKNMFNGIGYYQAGLTGQFNEQNLQIDTLRFSLNNNPLLEGTAKLDFGRKLLNGQFSGRGVDIEKLSATFLPVPYRMAGTAQLNLELSGTTTNPVLQTSVKINHGLFGKYPFNELSFSVSSRQFSDQNFMDPKNHELVVNYFRASQQGLYHVNSHGVIPLNANRPFDLTIRGDGDLFYFLPDVTPFFIDGTCFSEFQVRVSGNQDDVRFLEGEFNISRGELWLKDVAPHITDISGTLQLQPGTNKVDFDNFSATVDENTLQISTVRNISTSSGDKLQPWYFKGLDLDFGVIRLATSEGGVKVHIPGLMPVGETGKLYLSGRDEGEAFYFAGPADHPRLRGTVTLFDTRITYPIIEGRKTSGNDPVIKFLRDINWDLLVRSGENVRYIRDIPAYFDKVETELFVDELSPGLALTGIISQDKFRPLGQLSSSRGRLEYLDQSFRLDYFSVEFDRSSPNPDVSGQAWTTIRDSVGSISKTIYLKLFVFDETTGQELSRGDWTKFKFKLVSSDPQIGESQELVLAYMGYSVSNLSEKATSVGGAVTEKYLIRPLLRPLERAIERNLNLDLVRFNSSIARNLFYSSLVNKNYGKSQSLNYIQPFSSTAPYLLLMQSSELTLGKYLSPNIYVTYTGQLVSVYDENTNNFDFNHSVGLEYRFFRNVLIELEYDRELLGFYNQYNQKQYLEDFKIRLRHSFSF